MKRLIAGLVMCALLLTGICSTSEFSIDAFAAEIDETAVSETSDESVDDSAVEDDSYVASDEEIVDTDAVDADDAGVVEAADEAEYESDEMEETDSLADDEMYGPTEEDYAYIDEARTALKAIIAKRDVFGLVYLSDNYEIKAGASSDSDTVVTVASAQTVYIQDLELNENYEVWYKVSLLKGETEYVGYMQRSNLAISDVDFLAWEEEYNTDFSVSMFASDSMAMTYAVDGMAQTNATVSADIAQFPASYQTALKALKQAHPNWTFVKQDINFDWNSTVLEECFSDYSLMDGRAYSTVYRNGVSSQANWYYASRDSVAYFMDPRNFLDETYIYMFELLSYNATQTQSTIEKMLQNSFMNSSIPDDSADPENPDHPNGEITYSQAIYEAGKDAGVSPIHLASRLLQEQGTGTSAMISGTFDNNGQNPELLGYYNYFNIGAPTGPNVIIDGLTYAKSKGWNTRLKSIRGGATALGVNYINRGQDTLYLQKWNLSSSGKPTHQYMQNITAPLTESARIKTAYVNTYGGASSTEYKNSTFVFKIPVYKNMPSTASAKPTENHSVSLTSIPSGYSTSNGIYGSTVYIDGIAYTPLRQNGLMVTVSGTDSKVATMYKYNADGSYAGMYVWLLNWSTSKKCYEVTAMPELENLIGYNGFSIRITGDTGIRMKSSISIETRNLLTADGGINGYTLSDYGTIYMTKANSETYPLVKGGAKTATAMAYGTKSDGTRVDNIYEEADGKYRYTVVLTKLPTNYYKTDITFKPYVTLTKDGKEYTIYGDSKTRNMYSLAKSYIDGNYYGSNTAEYKYLKSIMDNAQ